jgi:hypothetical protein
MASELWQVSQKQCQVQRDTCLVQLSHVSVHKWYARGPLAPPLECRHIVPPLAPLACDAMLRKHAASVLQAEQPANMHILECAQASCRVLSCAGTMRPASWHSKGCACVGVLSAWSLSSLHAQSSQGDRCAPEPVAHEQVEDHHAGAVVAGAICLVPPHFMIQAPRRDAAQCQPGTHFGRVVCFQQACAPHCC